MSYQQGLAGAIKALRSVGANPTGIDELGWQQKKAGTILWEGACRHGHAQLIRGKEGSDSYQVSF